MTSQKKAEPFRVTGEGVYRNRTDDVRSIRRLEGPPTPYKWTDENGDTYLDDGRYNVTEKETSLDLIARIDEAPAEEMAGLTGYVAIYDNGQHAASSVHYSALDKATGYSPNASWIIDLSTIRKDQLVKPDPKTETRRVYIAVLDDDRIMASFSPLSRYPSQIAMFETEMTYQHGEGLGQELPS